jgi:HEAT repeat protein
MSPVHHITVRSFPFVVSILALLLMFVLYHFASVVPEPSYLSHSDVVQGDPLDEGQKHRMIQIMVSHLEERDEVVRQNVSFSLAQIGKEAVAPIREFLRSDAARGKEEAIMALHEMGVVAKAALPELIGILTLDKPLLREHAAMAISQLGADSVPVLIEAMETEGIYHADVIFALARIGKDAHVATQHLIEAMEDKRPGVRAAAAFALGAIYVDHQNTVPVLVKALDDENHLVRFYGARSLHMIGSVAVAELIVALNDENEKVRANAAFTLGEVSPVAQEAVPHLVAAMGDASPEVRANAIFALGRLEQQYGLE